MDDLVSRKTALDAVLSIGHIAKLTDGDAVIRMSAVNYVLRNLPSAELVRCRDCKWKNKHNCTRAVELFIHDDDFCSWAERRTDG